MKRRTIIGGVIFVVAWSSAVAAASIGLARSCAPDPAPTVLITPDGGREARVIEEHVDEAREEHAEHVRTIEKTIVVRRIAHERARRDEEVAVRSRGRDALAAWLTDFGHTIGARDGGTP